jgi:hypothetical protein
VVPGVAVVSSKFVASAPRKHSQAALAELFTVLRYT